MKIAKAKKQNPAVCKHVGLVYNMFSITAQSKLYMM